MATAARTTARQLALFDELVALILAEGFAHFTLDDLAARLHCSKSTLYRLADSKDQLVRRATVHFFRGATEKVEAGLSGAVGARERIRVYLEAVGEQLRPASARFMEDLAADAAAREVYERNTRFAARRVQELITEGVEAGELRDAHAAFVGDVAAAAMVRIQQRSTAEATGLDDAEAYQELAILLTRGL
ncbi:TetR/AcrR family transcriptional regulator [Rhodococcus sp. SGAir0479]|uniref:TetR/AcrR family transcriptional regulator n=1 Tax=Rhodococcus sp. SGAir0479 TaxID=2567884 RepID=UPI0010CCEC81|nr:TetR family transcriptional regulator [Rhodococcus sp. SGAir0479]QCQ92158.1 TetR family transcriptional regulator [Rhodococcus sp. SGAir0479]